MAVTVDAATSGGSAITTGNTGKTWNHTCGATANKLVVCFGTGISGGDIDRFAATYNGVAMTRRASAHESGWSSVEIFTLDSPATGSALQVKVNDAGNVGTYQMAGTSLSAIGAATGAPATGSNSNTGSANGSFTIAASVSGALCVGAMFNDLGPIGTTNPSGTQVDDQENINSDSDYNCQRVDATGANTLLSWSHSSINWAAAGVALLPAAGGVTSGAGASAGVASVVGVGRSTDTTKGTTSAAASVVGVGVGIIRKTTSGVTSAAASVAGVGRSIDTTKGTTSAVASVVGIAKAIATARGTSSAGASVVGVGAALGNTHSGTGTSSAFATVAGIARAIAQAVGTSQASASVSGVGEGGTPPTVVTPSVQIGGGDYLSWKDELEARHRKRELEKRLARLVREEKKLVAEEKKTERKIEAERRQEKPIEGILSRYWEISLKVEQKKTEIRNVREELEQAIWFLTKRIEDEEDDEEELLLLL